ncbi:MAG TPA: TrkA family potassium uptake protein [Candidatus Onthovivens sp.]|nr:TrkA family potassium uptake protein [Candidatus Onthovivens sp.]
MRKRKESIGIIGLGKFGFVLAQKLVMSGKQIICIDKDEKKVKRVLAFNESSFVSEDLSKEMMLELGMDQCQYIVICIGDSVDSSIFATINAKSLGKPQVIALSNSEEQGLVLEKLGAEVVYPYLDSADKLSRKILSGNVLDFISLSNKIEIMEFKIPRSLIGKKVIDSGVRSKYDLNIITIESLEGITTAISANYIFKDTDRLVVIGEITNLRKFSKKL